MRWQKVRNVILLVALTPGLAAQVSAQSEARVQEHGLHFRPRSPITSRFFPPSEHSSKPLISRLALQSADDPSEDTASDNFQPPPDNPTVDRSINETPRPNQVEKDDPKDQVEPSSIETQHRAEPVEVGAEEKGDPTKLLMNALGRSDSPVKVYGWIQNSYTGNANGVPASGINFGVNPNFLANRWMGNQYYLIVENPLEANDKINFGFRVDNLFGNDWQFNHMRGLFDSSFRLNHFAGYDPAQFYAEVHLPYLTKGGLDIKGGRFFTILGYEVVPATGRPLLSVPYMFNYGQPFTHFGMLSTLHVTDRLNWYNGAVNGWDRWVNDKYKWNYLGGLSWTSKSGKATLSIAYIFGPNQYPNYPNNPQITLPGQVEVLRPNFLAGRINPNYEHSSRTLFTTVLSYKWTDKLTQAIETDQGLEVNVPGVGPGGSNKNVSWQGFGNWFLYSFNDKWMGVWRAEVFRDNNGIRTGFADNFYEQTLGLIYKPKPWLWIRPEARYDWAQFTKPYNDGTRGSQFTIGLDAVILY